MQRYLQHPGGEGGVGVGEAVVLCLLGPPGQVVGEAVVAGSTSAATYCNSLFLMLVYYLLQFTEQEKLVSLLCQETDNPEHYHRGEGEGFGLGDPKHLVREQKTDLIIVRG